MAANFSGSLVPESDESNEIDDKQPERLTEDQLRRVFADVLAKELSPLLNVVQHLWTIQDMILRLEQKFPVLPPASSAPPLPLAPLKCTPPATTQATEFPVIPKFKSRDLPVAAVPPAVAMASSHCDAEVFGSVSMSLQATASAAAVVPASNARLSSDSFQTNNSNWSCGTFTGEPAPAGPCLSSPIPAPRGLPPSALVKASSFFVPPLPTLFANTNSRNNVEGEGRTYGEQGTRSLPASLFDSGFSSNFSNNSCVSRCTVRRPPNNSLVIGRILSRPANMGLDRTADAIARVSDIDTYVTDRIFEAAGLATGRSPESERALPLRGVLPNAPTLSDEELARPRTLDSFPEMAPPSILSESNKQCRSESGLSGVDFGAPHTPASLDSSTSSSVVPIGEESEQQAETALPSVALVDAEELVRSAASQWQRKASGEGSLACLPAFLLLVTGIMPDRLHPAWRFHRLVVLLVMASLLAFCVFRVAAEDYRYHNLSTACMALGSLLGLAKSGNMTNLMLRDSPLANYANYLGFTPKWRAMGFGRFLVVVSLLAFGLAAKTLNRNTCTSSTGPTRFAVDAIVDGTLGLLVYCQLHICCGLELAVDTFCTRLFCEGTLVTAATAACQWNILQAMVRRTAQYLEVNFLIVTTSILAQMMLATREVVLRRFEPLSLHCGALWASWLLGYTALAFYTIFQAAALTHKCEHVPSIVNSWSGGESEHFQTYFQERANLVQYIQSSAAGFYVHGVRLSAGFALKLVYLFAALAFTILSSFMTED